MIRTLAIAVVLSSVLAACGGGSADAPVPTQSAPTQATPPAHPACAPRVVSVALLGDSTMYGYDSADETAWTTPSIELQKNMDAQFGAGNVVVTNYAVSGTTSAQANQISADIRVANYGINDMRIIPGDTPEAFAERMKSLNLTLVETQNPILAGDEFNQSGYADAARNIGIPVADTYAYVLSLPDWQSHLHDGIHPDDALYVLIVANVLAPAIALQVAPLRCMK